VLSLQNVGNAQSHAINSIVNVPGPMVIAGLKRREGLSGPPKLHVLESHGANTLRLYGNTGMFSEQTMERAHAVHNASTREFAQPRNWNRQKAGIVERTRAQRLVEVQLEVGSLKHRVKASVYTRHSETQADSRGRAQEPCHREANALRHRCQGLGCAEGSSGSGGEGSSSGSSAHWEQHQWSSTSGSSSSGSSRSGSGNWKFEDG
jgi:hypothetical protein